MESVNLLFLSFKSISGFSVFIDVHCSFHHFFTFQKKKKPMLSPRDLIIIIPGHKNWVSRVSVIKTLKW